MGRPAKYPVEFRKAMYSPRFPAGFASISNARTFVDEFFDHYNNRHRHSGIGLNTPTDVHHGHAEAIRTRRQHVLDAAYDLHPERFRQPPSAPRIPKATWINPPQETPLANEPD